MKIFFLDLWHDLQAKRLVPVAVVLLVGLVAVPVVLSKPADEPRRPRPSTRAQRARAAKGLKQLARSSSATTSAGDGSSLNVFDPSNPFKPPKKVTIEEGGAARRTPGRRHRGRQHDRHARHRAAPAAPAAATPAATRGGDTGGGTGGGEATTTTTVSTRYVVDVTFMANGHTRHIKGMEKLDMLPSQVNAAADLHGRHGERRQRGLPGGLHAEGRRRGQVQAQPQPSAPSSTSAPAPSRSSPTRTATPTACGSTRSARSRSAPVQRPAPAARKSAQGARVGVERGRAPFIPPV